MMSLQCLKGWFTLPYWQALAMPLRVVYIVLLASSGNAPKGGLHCPTGKLYNASEEVGKIWLLVVNTKN